MMKTAIVQLGDVCEFVRGITFSSGEGKPIAFDNSIACLTTSGVQEDVAWNSRRFVQRTRVGSAKQMLQAGDILISTANSKELVGKSCLVYRPPFPCTFGAFVTVARPQPSLYPPYLSYWMMTREYLAWCYKHSSNTTNISNLRVSELEELGFPMPDLSEQRRIVGRLEQADGLRRTRRNTLALSVSFFPAAFLQIFGDASQKRCFWPLVQIAELCESIVDCVNKTAPTVDEITPYTMIRTSNIRSGEIQLDKISYVSEETWRTWTRRSVPRWGDVILTREAPLGEVGILRSNRKIFLGQRLVQYRAAPGRARPEYILHALQSPDVQRQLRSLGAGSTVEHVAVPECEALLLPEAPLKEQQAFSSLVERHERLIAAQREALRQAEHLFQALLYDAFGTETTHAQSKAHHV